MIEIDRKLLEQIAKESNSKSELAINRIEVRNNIRNSIFNMSELFDNFDVYEMCHWINFNDRWIANRASDNRTTYKRGEILFVDLGASNFKYEPSFVHPVIVLKNEYSSLLVVPCSSKKYGKNLRNVLDATKEDGFFKGTGIQLDCLRFINKNRVVIRTEKKVSSRVLKEIDSYIESLSSKHKITVKEIDRLKNECIEVIDKNKRLTIENKKIIEENEFLKEKCKELEKRLKELVPELSYNN